MRLTGGALAGGSELREAMWFFRRRRRRCASFAKRFKKTKPIQVEVLRRPAGGVAPPRLTAAPCAGGQRASRTMRFFRAAGGVARLTGGALRRSQRASRSDVNDQAAPDPAVRGDLLVRSGICQRRAPTGTRCTPTDGVEAVVVAQRVLAARRLDGRTTDTTATRVHRGVSTDRRRACSRERAGGRAAPRRAPTATTQHALVEAQPRRGEALDQVAGARRDRADRVPSTVAGKSSRSKHATTSVAR